MSSPTIPDSAAVAAVWTPIQNLDVSLEAAAVKIRGRVCRIKRMKKIIMLTVRENWFTVQCVVESESNEELFNECSKITPESIVDLCGTVKELGNPMVSNTQKDVELVVTNLTCLSLAKKPLPFSLMDSDSSGKMPVPVHLSTRLNSRAFDLRSLTNKSIFAIQNQIEKTLTTFLWNKDFTKVHTPRLLSGTSSGGAAVFQLKYNKKEASLAQSTQIHKQMLMCGDFKHIFEIGPVFRAEKSDTNRHLCEYTAIDVEMELADSYFEVMDLVDKLFVSIFDDIANNCKRELAAVGCLPLKYLPITPRISYKEGVKMLEDAGVMVEYLRDLTPVAEKTLGELMLKKYQTDFFILYEYPLGTRPFFTMPKNGTSESEYSNSFDVFLRGAEVISGGERIHDPALLENRAVDCHVNIQDLNYFIDSFRFGAAPRGGFGAGLERLVMQYCGLDNVRKASLFPRDPKRIVP